MFFLSDTIFLRRALTWKRYVHQILRGNEEAKFISIGTGGFVRRNTLCFTKFITAAPNDLSVFRDRALYGIGLEPLLVDPLLWEPIHVNTSVLGYEVI
jgi:hypothetical protein